MEELILDILKNSEKALTSIEISDILNLQSSEQLTELLDALRKLEESYKIYKSNKSRYMLFENSHLKKGRLIVNKKGFGFVSFSNSEKDIYIDKKNLRGALNNDIVVVEPLKSSAEKPEGRIVKVLKEENNIVIGEYNLDGNKPIFILDDEKLNIKVLLDKEEIKGLITGLKLEVSIVKTNKKNIYKGHIINVIGHKDDPGVDILSIVYKYKIKDKFEKEVIDELKNIPSEVQDIDKKNRRDLTKETIFTIDGKDTKDIDDAVSIKKEKDYYILGVHIADVSYYVKEGTNLYNEAKERGTSVYLVDRVIPMIPHKLSNGICSLNPLVDRLAISCVMKIDKSGNVVDYDIFESVINSKKQMNYESVNKLLKGERVEDYKPFEKELKLMNELSKILRKNKLDRGYLDFDSKEPKILVDKKGKPYEITARVQDEAENMIEDFMIVANETVASYIYYMNLPFVYRVHEVPEDEKIKEFLGQISLLGYNIKGTRHFKNPKALKNILDQLKDKEEFDILSNMLLRCMKKAVYKEENLGHYGLGSKCYTHFTSPIRRFPDTTVHKLLREYIFNKPKEKELSRLIDKYKDILPEICEHSSSKERASIECERDVDDMKMAEYMESHIGEEYEGEIDSIMNFGMFIRLPNLVEGLVHISEIEGDYYIYNDTTKTLRGQRKGKIYKIGQKVKVVVTGASKQNSTIDFKLIESKEK